MPWLIYLICYELVGCELVKQMMSMIQLAIPQWRIATGYMLDIALLEVIDYFPRLSLSRPLTWRSRASAGKSSIRLAHSKNYAVIVLGHNVR
jgi:hypothetical protein